MDVTHPFALAVGQVLNKYLGEARWQGGLLTGSGTYTVPAYCHALGIICQGAGGAGGGAIATSSTQGSVGGGGGGGGWVFDINEVITPGDTFAYSVGIGGLATVAGAGGAGGDTTFGPFITASGGSGGIIKNATVPGTVGQTGGAGGGASGGTLNIPGSDGGAGFLLDDGSSIVFGINAPGGGAAWTPPLPAGAFGGQGIDAYNGGGGGGALEGRSGTAVRGGYGGNGYLWVIELF